MGKKLRAVLGAALALVFAFSAIMAVRWRIEQRRIVADRGEAERVAGLPPAKVSPLPSATPPPSWEPTPQPLPEEAAALAELDLDGLREVNGDVIGWILIPGTELSYPVVQGADNQYYLTHNWKKEPSGGGAVFLECTNSSDFMGFNTIVYAHRMNNETMFGTLKYYDRIDFWREHPSVYVATEGTVRRYEIFSAEEAGVREIVYRLDLEESALEEEFIEYCVDSSEIETGVVPGVDDRILSLSTCTAAGRPETRWVVHAYLAQEYPMASASS